MSTIPIQSLINNNDTDIGLSTDLLNGNYKTSSLTDLSNNLYTKISDLSNNLNTKITKGDKTTWSQAAARLISPLQFSREGCPHNWQLVSVYVWECLI